MGRLVYLNNLPKMVHNSTRRPFVDIKKEVEDAVAVKDSRAYVNLSTSNVDIITQDELIVNSQTNQISTDNNGNTTRKSVIDVTLTQIEERLNGDLNNP